MNRGKGGLAFPGMTRLAKMARTTARTVIRGNAPDFVEVSEAGITG
jgi:hypothetical protein